MKYRAKTENSITIYNNAIVHKGHITLFFCVNLYNYNIYTEESIEQNLDTLQNMLLNIENIFGTFRFSILRFEDVLPADTYLEDFIKTVHLWDESFIPSDEFSRNITAIMNHYCLLAVNIDEDKAIDFNETSIKDIVNQYKDKFLDSIASYKQQNIDTKLIDETAVKIANVGQQLIRPCPEKLLLDYYIKRVYPSYNLIIADQDIEDTKSVLAYLQQDLIPHFNYFEMSNAGVELFGAMQKTTYGSVIDIVELPEEIISESFALNFDWLVINAKTLSKNQAKLKFKRKLRDIEFEEDSALSAGSPDYNYELQEYKDLSQTAIAAVSLGRKIIEADIHIFIEAKSEEELNQRRFKLLSVLKNQGITATFAPDQAKAYVESFVNLRPSKYDFIMDLRYPLAFRMPQGAAVGDFDSEFKAPPIGEVASRDEAVE